jgi:hypothetical protein
VLKPRHSARSLRRSLGALEISYGAVERALAVAHNVPDAVRQAGFRSMLSNLQKLGALGAQARVGRGAALKYTPTELHRLVLTLEFCELGIPPAMAVSLVNTYWESKLKAIIGAAERGVVHEEPPGNDVIIHLGGVSLRTGSLRGEQFPGVPNLNQCKFSELPSYIKQWMAMKPSDPVPPRALVVNLSARLRTFHSALADAYMDELRAERRATLSGERPRPRAPKARKHK